ncbi:uncharacterized protein LOC131219183 isoform X2 [Magnolia sinica]|uniref:uncharacterized protein LOC131219183 isoform X2 n=1 Tax=Magnolia sinica TaxID=86752 RepID=UPI002657CB58|nr:uncharacterized protein LOC131219183 isoform X2 [Magnolia sinica]
MSYVGPSNSAPGSTTKIKVSISPVGEITGDNKNQFTSFLGNVVRTHCPIAYKDWRLVPDTIKDNVWSTVLAKYDVDDSDKCKTVIIKRANDMWKDWKNRLRGTVLDMYDNDGDRKKNCPNGIKLEDWVKFVDYESTEEAKSRRGKGKESRSEMKFPHTTGRRGSARTAELIELSITTEKIKDIVANDPACIHNDLNHDPVAQVCGLDKRGRVRGLGHIAKTTIIASTPYINEIREGKGEIAEVKASMIVLKEQMENKINECKDMILTIGERLLEVQNQINTPVQPMQCSPGTAGSQAFFRSGDTSSHRDESAPPPPLLRVEQICHLTDICSRVVARGRLIRDNAGIPPDCIKVILDVVEVPSANVFGDIEKTLADCDVGDVLVWPRVLTKT